MTKRDLEDRNHMYNALQARETGAKKRLAKIMKQHQSLQAYIQGDPRGAALYILRPGDVPTGKEPDQFYSRGICVY